MIQRVATGAVLIMVLAAVMIPHPVSPVGVAAADDDDDDDGDVIEVNIDASGIINAVKNVTAALTTPGGGLSTVLVDTLHGVLFTPFLFLLEQLADMLVDLFVYYPDVTQDGVRQVHAFAFRVALLYAGLIFTLIGGLYLFNRLLWFHRLLPMIPQVLAALGFAAVAPDLLQFPVEAAELTTIAMLPQSVDVSALAVFSLDLIVVAIIDAFLLLGVTMLFVVRDVYLLFAVAASPLIAIGLATPYFKRFAQPLVGVFWGFLLIGPVDALVLRLTLELLSVENGIPSWVVGAGGFILLLGVPYVVLSAGMTLTRTAAAFAGGAASTRLPGRESDAGMDGQDMYFEEMPHTLETREVSRRAGGNRFNKEAILDDD